MKLAHISLIFSKGNMIGVEKKLIDEAQAMNKNGIDFYVLNREIDGIRKNIHYIDIDKLLKNKLFPELYLRSFRYEVIATLIDLHRYDFFILRYPMIDFSAFKFSNDYKQKIITEHHTKELEEIRVLKIREPFKSIQYLFEKYGSKYFFKNVYGVIGISNDVLVTLKNRLNNQYIRSYVFSNGISIKNYNQRKTPKLNKTFHLVFVASVFNKWHGLDRLLKSCSLYKGDRKVCLHLVGKINDEYSMLIKNSKTDYFEIILHGKKTQEELSELYKSMHMACDSLAMFRLNMSQSSTLKSKECILHTLPFLYSAPDLDLVSVNKYLYDCGNSKTLIDIENVMHYYENIDKVNMSIDFKNCLETILNWDVKVKKLCDWIKR